ncbi:MAG TPA: hypothetical protein VNG53_02235 [Bacteroidia bacterium]|nr:hypothetical protein [Bacteroidia bacterium]
MKEILTTYWSQTTLILLGIGYLIKNVFDLRAKKAGINHELFQQKKLESVSLFFLSCAKTEHMWKGIAIWDILQNKLTTKEIDKIIFPHINELRRSVLELNIYFDEHEHENFSSILKNMLLINSKLHDMFFYREGDKTLTQKVNDFLFVRDNMLERNELIFKQISANLKKAFQ